MGLSTAVAKIRMGLDGVVFRREKSSGICADNIIAGIQKGGQSYEDGSGCDCLSFHVTHNVTMSDGISTIFAARPYFSKIDLQFNKATKGTPEMNHCTGLYQVLLGRSVTC